MILTTKARYAITAMIELAQQSIANKPVALHKIAEQQKIAITYLEQIFASLRKAELVSSAKGRDGGYILAREAKEIKISDIIIASGEKVKMTSCGQGKPCVKIDLKCQTHQLWKGLELVISDYFSAITLADFANQKPEIYLDYAATSNVTSNPSSIHARGRRARAALEEARSKILTALTDCCYDLTFTASATEANNLIISSAIKNGYRIIATGTEHLSVLVPAGDKAVVCGVDENGVIDLEELEKLASSMTKPFFLSLMLVNNETGVIQPIEKAAEIIHKYGGLIHSDMAQALGKIHISLKDIDFASISSHKIGGPVGAAALLSLSNSKLQLQPMILGGGQERSIRSGTENLAAASGFAKAVVRAKQEVEQYQSQSEMMLKLETELLATGSAQIIGRGASRVAGISLIAATGKNAPDNTVQLIAFDMAGIMVSNGSACSSGKASPSLVVKAIGKPELANKVIRISIGTKTKWHELEKFLIKWKEICTK